MRFFSGVRLLILGATLAGAALALGTALALFADTASVPGNTFSTDTLNAPTGLSATGGIGANLSWTATSDTYATGYNIYRSTTSGSYGSSLATVTPRTATTYSDSSLGAGTYYYVVRAYYQNWESVNSNEISCTKVAAVVTCP